jgi:hypothetical protein
MLSAPLELTAVTTQKKASAELADPNAPKISFQFFFVNPRPGDNTSALPTNPDDVHVQATALL